MHDETIAIHGGYKADGTRAVAVPIYQTIAHEFENAEHAGAVLDLEVPGFHAETRRGVALGVQVDGQRADSPPAHGVGQRAHRGRLAGATLL